MAAAASESFREAWYSPSAVMIRDRRSRSASAWRDIERFIVSGKATSLTSTRSISMPQEAAEHHLEPLIEVFPVGQQVVELALPNDRAKRSLRHLGDGELVVLHLDHCTHGVDHPEV